MEIKRYQLIDYDMLSTLFLIYLKFAVLITFPGRGVDFYLLIKSHVIDIHS